MKKNREAGAPTPAPEVSQAWEQVSASFERFCLTAGLSALSEMMEQDATELGLSVICVQKVPLRKVSKINVITPISEVMSLI